MTDPATLSRISLRPGIRPNQPMGPRTRQRTSNLNGLESLGSSISAESTLGTSVFSAPVQNTSPRTSNPNKSLTVISESDNTFLPHFESAPAYEESPPLSPSRISVRSLPKSIKLAPQPIIKFDPIPVKWKGLPMQAALWTFDSKELQTLVSRAIRSSARESFIHLLSLELLDTTLPEEFARLTSLKGMTQSKYRFLVYRRTMLLQALNSLSTTTRKGNDGDESLTISQLTVQLSETTAECDKLMEEILSISDQIAQISKLLDVHWASALAVALRKLNGSYSQRTSDLNAARERITQLEAERDEAWKEAEKLAKQIDEQDTSEYSDDDDEAVIGTAEIVSVSPPASPRLRTISIKPTIMGVISSALLKEPMRGLSRAVDVPDSVSIRSNHSTRSAKSMKSIRSFKSTTRSMRIGPDESRVSLVSAARKRSIRATEASLRFTHTHRRNQSTRTKTPHDGEPPVPDLPLQFTSTILSTPSAIASSTLLDHYHSRSSSAEYGRSGRRRLSLDALRSAQPPSSFPGPGTKDDIYLRQNRTSDEIQLVPRIQPLRLPSEEISLINKKKCQSEAPSKFIPSIWINADTPKPTPVSAEVPASDNSKPKSTFKTLTKRYSLPLSMFSSKSILLKRATSRRSG